MHALGRVFLTSLLVLGRLGAAHGQNAVPLFDGETLTGWEGDPAVWFVQQGAICGQTTRPTGQNTFLLWRGAMPQDFEFACHARLTRGNSGIQYRSRELGRYVVAGYQCEISNTRAHAGFLYEERGRKFLAYFGERVELPVHGPRRVLERAAQPQQLLHQQQFVPGGWNHYRIVAQGPHLQHFVNGVKTVDVLDYEVEQSSARGVLALQVHASLGMKVEFKELALRSPPATPAAPKPNNP